MKRFILSLVLLSVLTSTTAFAQLSGSLNVGYIHTQGTAINSAFTGFDGQGTFSYGDLDISYAIKPNVSAMIGVGGFLTETKFSAGPELTAQTITVPVSARIFFSEESGKPRGFIDVGPSINFLKFELKGAAPYNFDITETKVGGIGGIGFLYPFSSSVSLIGRVRYSFVAKSGEFDASSFQATIGLGFGG